MTIPTRLNRRAKSEFGKGLVICLVKFAEHAEKWLQDREMYKNLHEPAFLNESLAVELFFNGASDHLYDIQVPEKWQGTAIERKVKELQDFALAIGHGFTGQQWSEKDVITAYDLCRKIALLIDKELGLSPDIGKY